MPALPVMGEHELGKHIDSAVIELISLRLEAGWYACSLADRVDLFSSILRVGDSTHYSLLRKGEG